METPTNAFYEGLTQDQLFEQLQEVEVELCDIHARRAELNQEEQVAQEHRMSIQRALGCVVLEDRRNKNDNAGTQPAS